MAAAPPSFYHPGSSSSSSYSGKWEYDVFLCFRGADTRHGFTGHLRAALHDRQIKAFIDDMLDKTESIDELISVLKRSALSVVIFSEKFADSSWCLDEVATISRSMVEFGHRVLPVFYKVYSSDVSEDSGSYTAAIEQHHGSSASPEDRKRWMDALKVVANCAGYTSHAIKIDSELVEKIVNGVLKRLAEISHRVKFDHLVGMDARVSEVEQLLAMNVDDFRIIGLWGMGGIGKTTLATACYQSFVSSGKEMKHHFIQNINEKLEKQSGIEGMVHELYSILLSEANLNCHNLGIDHRRERLSRLRVFLVLDNVETVPQLEQLLLGDKQAANLFGPGSRIIVTTRNRRVLENAGAHIYEVKHLHSHESLQLFGIHAFKNCLPLDDYVDLSSVAVSYCKGSPLAIKVLGCALLNKQRSYWKSFLSELEKNPKLEILDVLRRSYNELEIVKKGVFLDIACFFPGVLKSLVINCFPTSYIEDLIDKSLVSCVFSKGVERIEVHDLLREMAWVIVNEESKFENRSRFKNADDVYKLLAVGDVKTLRRFNYLNIMKSKEKHGSAFEPVRTTEGILLNLSEATDIHMEANAFERMTSLRFLKFTYWENDRRASKVRVPYGGLVTLPNSLKWLEWHKFPSKSLPSRFSPENLVVLNLRTSPLLKRCWKAEPQLLNLVGLDLSRCINLEAVPNLSGSPKLERLYLEGCKRLIELPSHVQDLDKLIELDLDDCTNLQILPPKLNSKFLNKVHLSNCPKVTRCPEINSTELEVLNLTETPVTALPRAIYNIKLGGRLRLCGEHITRFPAISTSLEFFRLCHTTITEMDCYDGDDHHQLASLPRFARLVLIGNPQLKSLSSNVWNMVSQTLILEDCPLIESLPEISQPGTGLTSLSIRGCWKLKSFPTDINNLKYLQFLDFVDTDIESLPLDIVELDQLSHLELRSNKSLEFVPSNIHKLAKLSYLSLAGCSRIKYLPELPPNLLTLDVSGCTLLRALPSNIGKLRCKKLWFEDCPQLDPYLPQEVVLNFCNHAMSNLYPQGVLQYSASEIPRWFAFKSPNYASDSCMMGQLTLPNCTTTRLIKGIAFGVVCSSDIGQVMISITCNCNIGTGVAASWSSPVFCFGKTQSDNVYIWYEKNLLGETEESMREEAEPWYVRYAGLTVLFRFSLQPGEVDEGKREDPKRLKRIKIKRTGVSLLY
ncbi:unnamed protein product [Linum trigynum]|uniref:TIR domain-containing protein n=1 Tax=Linum trigynum TaxID=586398 RepID=A0AAV2D389_9ROSI